MDCRGRPEFVTNAHQAVVWRAYNYAYGRGVQQDDIGGLNIGFPGQYYDQESGHWYNGLRDLYDASIGRYAQPDPMGQAGGLNLYAYVDGDPVNLVDEHGLRGTRPNSWDTFQQQAGGRGLTRAQISSIYRQVQLNNAGWNRDLKRELDNFPGPVPVPDINTVKCNSMGYCTVQVNICSCSNQSEATSCPAQRTPSVGPMPQDSPSCACTSAITPVSI